MRGLPGKLALQLRGREAQLPRQLLRALSQLSRTQRSGLRQLLRRKTSLRRQLLRRHAQLALLLRGLCRQFFGRKTQLTRSLCRGQARLRALRTQRPCKLRSLLRSSLLGLKRRLRTLRCRLKACLTHLRCRAALLFQNVALQLLLGHRLTAAPERAGLHSLCGDALLGQLALTRNVRKRLLHGRIFEWAHKRARGGGVKSTRRACQSSNALLRGRCAKSASLLQSPSSLRRNAARIPNSRCRIKTRLLSNAPATNPGLLCYRARCFCASRDIRRRPCRTQPRAAARGPGSFSAGQTGCAHCFSTPCRLRPRSSNCRLRSGSRRLRS